MLFRQGGFNLIAQDLHPPMQMLSTYARAITGEKIVGREREHKSAMNCLMVLMKMECAENIIYKLYLPN